MKKAPEDHLPPYRIRPRFQIESSLSMELLTEKFRLALSDKNAPCKGQVNPGFSTFYLPVEEQHYWSPQLSISFEESEKGCVVRGLYGPRPAVWTMFVFFYSVIAFLILVISVIAFANISLGHYTGILYFIPILIFIFLTLYFVADMGQRMGHDQMLILQGFFEGVFEE